MKYPTHTFLFDDDDDTDRSGQGQGTTSYSTLTNKLSNRQSYLTPKSSGGNYSLQQTRAPTTPSLFTCCGFTIDLSQKSSYSSNSKSPIDDSLTRRSTLNRKPTFSSSKNLSVESAISSNNRVIRQQKTVCYRSTNINRPIIRRRATTVVDCSRDTPVTTMTTLTNKSSPIQRSISKEKRFSLFEKSTPIIDIPPTTKDGCQTNMNLTESLIIVQTDCDELPLPASIIERC
jgi:hypothetical protein